MCKNQEHNLTNAYQGTTKKVLTVCSAGLLRSATLQNVLISEKGYNVRNCGTEDYALIPISKALCLWADEIVFVNNENYKRVELYIREWNLTSKVRILNIPDIYNFNEPELRELCLKQYKE